MYFEPPVLWVLDLVGTFVFGLNGALTALRATRLDVVGVVTLGALTAVGGPPATMAALGALSFVGTATLPQTVDAPRTGEQRYQAARRP